MNFNKLTNFLYKYFVIFSYCKNCGCIVSTFGQDIDTPIFCSEGCLHSYHKG